MIAVARIVAWLLAGVGVGSVANWLGLSEKESEAGAVDRVVRWTPYLALGVLALLTVREFKK